MMEETSSYTIEIETPREYIQSLIDFIDQKYIKPQRERFADVSRQILDGFPSIAFTLLDSTGKQSLSVEVIGSKPLKLNIKRFQPTVSMEVIEEAKQDIIIVVEFFEEKVRRNTGDLSRFQQCSERGNWKSEKMEKTCQNRLSLH